MRWTRLGYRLKYPGLVSQSTHECTGLGSGEQLIELVVVGPPQARDVGAVDVERHGDRRMAELYPDYLPRPSYRRSRIPLA